jgi:hypothetical protein
LVPNAPVVRLCRSKWSLRIIEVVNRPLDVLLLENRPGAGEAEQSALESAGHRVHRCHPADDSGFGCVGITGDRQCPLDGPIDVTLLVRRGVSPRSTPFEDGVRCAIRRGVPIVEHGAEALDPYSPWITHRVALGESVTSACVNAADRAMDPLLVGIAERIRPVLRAAAVDPEHVMCELERDGETLEVHLTVSADVDARLEQALAVRVLDAVRSSTGTYGQVSVQVHSPTASPGA